MGEVERLADIARHLEPAQLAVVIDLAERLLRREAEADDLGALDVAWLESDASGLEGLEPFDWGPAGEPAGMPVRWDATLGDFVASEAP